MRSPLVTVALSLALAATAAGAQEIFSDGFESGTPWAWSRLPGGTDPRAVCTPPIAPVDMTGATVVGNGTSQSCTEGALDAAIATALPPGSGKIAFACGPAPHTIVVTSEKAIPASLVLDGGGLVTLSGGGTTRILALRPPFGTTPLPVLTLQNLTLRDGSTAALPGTTIVNGGGAIYRETGGHLRILDSTFLDNAGPAVGQDVAGGAVYSFGEGTTTIVRSTFTGNHCSSGGALGALGTNNHQLLIYDSLIAGNAATGTGGNPGNGGNGGGIYMDGNNQTVTICGSVLSANDANARGAGLFRVSNNGVGPMTIDRSSVLWNRSPAGPDSQAGGLYLQGLQLTILDSTIAGNVASSAGGIFLWTNPGTQTAQMTNVTIAENHARGSLGAGMSVASGVTGTLRHLTIARNSNEGAASFASAIAGGAGLSLSSSLVTDNSKVFEWEDTSCNVTHAGDVVFQWPEFNEEGESERPCAQSTTFLDAGIGPLAWSGGPTPTIAPSHPALDGAAGSNCPATDQRGVPRGSSCTPGAVEMP
ncbi:MAG: choice-of-anchor Q domain-containing protein [Thermoanaerobaculia bacterium]